MYFEKELKMMTSGSSKRMVAGLMVLLVFASFGSAKATRQPGDGLLRMVPAESLFCVRVNNLNKTLTITDQFLAGAAPFATKAMVYAKLSQLLGSEEPAALRKRGGIAVFAVIMPGDSEKPKPFKNIFLAVLMPVTNYGEFISKNPNASKADNKGISKISLNDKPVALVAKAGRYALMCSPRDYDKLLKAKSTRPSAKKSLSSVLDEDEAKLAAGEPIWAYANIASASKTFAPVVLGKIEEVREMLKKAQADAPEPMADPEKIMDMYAEIFKVLMNELQYYSIALNPSAKALKITETVSARKGTDLAEVLSGGDKKAGAGKLAYLEDGAMMNFVSNVNPSFMAKSYAGLIDLIAELGITTIAEEDMTKIKALVADSFEAMGDSVAINMFVDGKEDFPFALKYVIELKDEKKFARVIDEEMKMMESGVMADFYKGMGMTIDAKVKRGIGEYKGVSIDSAKLKFESTEPDSQQGKMIEAMYGDGFDYRWAILEGYCVYAIGPDADSQIRELIDRVKAGGPKKMGPEMKKALALIKNADQADFAGTFNFVRMLTMVTSMMQKVPQPGPAMPNIDMQSKSSIAFAGNFGDGKLTTESALPKEHLVELMGVFGKFMKQMMQQQKQQLKAEIGKAGFTPLFNGKDLKNWETSGKARWVVVDGMLVGTQGANNAPGDLFTKQTYTDFELTCTYKVEWPCNTGIWFRYQSSGKAYQADILEYKNPVAFSGTLYCPGKMFIAKNLDKELVNREGWNTMRVRAKGDHLEVWLNGRQVADVHDDTSDSGRIGFQVHPGAQFGPMKVTVREILIKPL